MCGRSHSLYDVYKALDAVHAAAPPSWSLDLISGLPHLTEDTWHQSLSCALDAEPPHISVYDLQVLLNAVLRSSCRLCPDLFAVCVTNTIITTRGTASQSSLCSPIT